MPAQRRPLTIPLVSRDSSAAKGGRLTNCYSENGPLGPMVCKRAGHTVSNALGAGAAQGAATFNGEALFIKSDTLYSDLQPFASGSTWTAAVAPAKPTAGDVAGTTKSGYMASLGGNLYHIGGKDNLDTNISVYKSADNGASWSTILATAPFTGSLLVDLQAAVVYNNRIYVLLNTRAIWSTADGISWANDSTDVAGGGSRNGQCLIVHNNLLYAFVALNSTTVAIYSSPNGATWTSVNGGASGPGNRTNFAAASLAGILYIIAGRTGTLTIVNDVYKSADNGASWSQATAAAAFAAREWPACWVYNSKLWIGGGATVLAGTTVDDDVYSSTDGATWTSITAAAGWTARRSASCCVHNNTMYIGPGLGRSGGNTIAISSLHYAAQGGATSTSLTTPTQNSLPVQVALIPKNGATVAKAFIKSTKDAWVWDATSITKISDVDYPATTVFGVAYLDGTIYVMDSAGVIYGSDILAPTVWNALNFISANAEADAGIAIARQLDNIVAFKDSSLEFFYDAANATGSPLSKMPNALLEIGLASAASLAQSDNTLFWMSQHKQKGRSISKFEGTTPKQVSTPWVDTILDGDDLATIYAFVVRVKGHVFYFITLKTSAITLVYDDTMNEWHTATMLTALPAVTVSSIAVQADGSILVTTPTAHGASDGDPVVIAGATPTAANGSFNLRYDTSVHSTSQFSYGPATAVSGLITGTVTETLYQSNYFPGAYYAKGSAGDLVIDQATGNVYKIDPAIYQDNSAPVDMKIRTEREDFGTMTPKTYNALAIVGDNVSGNLAVRYCNDDYATFSKYRLCDLSKKRPRLTQLGSAERRAWEFRYTGNTPCRLQAADPDIDGWHG